MEEKRERWKTQPLSFYAGEYICGMDFPDGRYLIYDGDSNFCVYDDNGRLDVNIILGDDPDWGDIKEYLHFFEPGEIIQSDSPFKLKLVE